MFRLFKYFKWYHWIFILFIIGFIYLQVQLDLKLPEYIGSIIILIGTGVQTGTSQTSLILREGGEMLLIALGSIALTITVSYIAARLGTKLANTLRSNIFQKVQGFSSEEINTSKIENKLVTAVKNKFGHSIKVLVLKKKELETVFKSNPFINEANFDFKKTCATFLDKTPSEEGIEIGDIITEYNGSEFVEIEVTQVDLIDEERFVYQLDASPTDVILAGSLVVHNKKAFA